MSPNLESHPSARLGLGCVTFGREIDPAAAFAMLDHAWSKGIRMLDTAASYGGGASERIVGAWFAARDPDVSQLTIATKILPPFAPAQIETAVRASVPGAPASLRSGRNRTAGAAPRSCGRRCAHRRGDRDPARARTIRRHGAQGSGAMKRSRPTRVHGAVLGLTHPHSGKLVQTLENLSEIGRISLWENEGGAARAAEIPRSRKVAFVSGDLEAVLAQADLDFAIVAVWTDLAADVALRVIDVGKHLLAEKPVGRTAAEVRAVERAAKAAHHRPQPGPL